jgi:hypothetical protein
MVLTCIYSTIAIAFFAAGRQDHHHSKSKAELRFPNIVIICPFYIPVLNKQAQRKYLAKGSSC